MKSAFGRVIIAILLALLITEGTFLVGEFVMASPRGGNGGSQSGYVYGFPVPYATFIPCCSASGGPDGFVLYNNTYFFQPINIGEDFSIWLVISLAVVLTATPMAIALGAAAGLGITLLSLAFPPISMVMPTPAHGVLIPMGFPYDYLVYYVAGFLGSSQSGYDFYLSPAIADFGLWTGAAAAIFGIARRMVLGLRGARLPG
jgi:hypothetical protein